MSKADRLYQRVLDLRKECNEAIRTYREESVYRVLEFIKNEYKKGRVCDLDTLLTHCQNKLNGNIDGIELSLDEYHKGLAPEELKKKFNNRGVV